MRARFTLFCSDYWSPTSVKLRLTDLLLTASATQMIGIIAAAVLVLATAGVLITLSPWDEAKGSAAASRQRKCGGPSRKQELMANNESYLHNEQAYRAYVLDRDAGGCPPACLLQPGIRFLELNTGYGG